MKDKLKLRKIKIEYQIKEDEKDPGLDLKLEEISSEGYYQDN